MNEPENAKFSPRGSPTKLDSKEPPQTQVELQKPSSFQNNLPQGGHPLQFQAHPNQMPYPGQQNPFQPQYGQNQMAHPGPGMPGQLGQPGFYQNQGPPPGFVPMGTNPFAQQQASGGYRPGPIQPQGPQGFGGPRPPFQQYQNNQNTGTGLNQPLLGNGDRFGADNRGIPVQEESSGGVFGATQTTYGNCTGYLAAFLPCICCCLSNPYEIVPEGFAGIIQRFGKFYKLVGPGQHFLNKEVDVLILVDKREKLFELKRQAVVSKDNTSFLIDAVVYYKVVNTCKSKYAVANLEHSIEDLAVTTLRNVIGKLTLQEFLQKRDEITEQIALIVKEPAQNWGTEVHRVLVQDVLLPPEARTAFSTGVLSRKIAEAQVIGAKADVEAARLMKEAADALNTQAALQIRYLEALDHVSKSSNPKMVFFPADYKDVGTVNDDVGEEVQRLL